MAVQTPSKDVKHVGEYDDQKVVLLGFSKQEGRIFVLKIDSLNGRDQDWLGRIIESGHAQRERFLIKTLQQERHPSGDDAFTYVVQRGKTLRIPPQDVRLYSKEQAIDWFGEPSNYVLENERRAGRLRQPRQVIADAPATSELIPEPKRTTRISDIEPALPVPPANAPVEIAGLKPPSRLQEAVAEVARGLEAATVVKTAAPQTTTAAPVPQTVSVPASTIWPQPSTAAPHTVTTPVQLQSAQPAASEISEKLLSATLEALESVKQLAAKMEKMNSFETRLRRLERTQKDSSKDAAA